MDYRPVLTEGVLAMMRSKELRDFLQTQDLKPETVAAIEARLARVEIAGGVLKGSFSDCDTEFVLGDPELEKGFSVFHDEIYGRPKEEDPAT